MRILFLGGYGLVGSVALARLAQAGHEVVGLARSPKRPRLKGVEWRDGDVSRLTSPEDWRVWLKGVDAVVNCAGALDEGARDRLESVHVKGPDALYRACAEAGVRRVIHVSAAGIEAVNTKFARTKLEIEMRLRALELDWIILRPGLVLSIAAYGGTGLMRGLAGLPWLTPLSSAKSIIQTVSVGDVAATILFALESDAPKRAVFELVHSAPTTLADIVLAYRAWLGFPPRRVVVVPQVLVRLFALGGDAAAHFGWRNPLRSLTLRQLEHGVRGTPEEWINVTGIKPQSLEEFLGKVPSTMQERRFARLYFVKPLGIALLSLFWIASGLIALGPSREDSRAILLGAGLSMDATGLIVAASGLLDVAVGIIIAVRRTANVGLLLSVLISLAYLAAATILRPDLWGDPLGPLVKILPLILASIAVAALMDER